MNSIESGNSFLMLVASGEVLKVRKVATDQGYTAYISPSRLQGEVNLRICDELGRGFEPFWKALDKEREKKQELDQK